MQTKKITPAEFSEQEIEKIILDLARQGITAEKIGLILKNAHKIPKAKMYGVRISQVLKKNNLYIDPEKANIQQRIEKLKKHAAKNKQDHKPTIILRIKEAVIKKKNRS